MKIGAVYPQIESSGDPKSLPVFANAVEEIGFDHMLMYDHVVGALKEDRSPPLTGPYSEKDPFHEPLVALAYAAALTKRVELVSGVMILPQRQTVLVAKQAATIDLLSGGRLRIGVGTGWNYVEYDALGQDFASRGPRLSEQIPFLRRLWSEPLVTFEGKFDRIDRGNIVPSPTRQIPIYLGGSSDVAYKRAAMLGDGFIYGSAIERAIQGWSRTRRILEEAGRPIDQFGRDYLVMDANVRGLSPQEGADTIKRWQDAGGTHATVVTMGRGYKQIEQHIEHLREVWSRLNIE